VTQEQQHLRAELISRYGEDAFHRAADISGVRMCLAALREDALPSDERERLHVQANLHLEHLLDRVMTPEMSERVGECARRIDAAVDVWSFDEIEKREGLPPLQATGLAEPEPALPSYDDFPFRAAATLAIDLMSAHPDMHESAAIDRAWQAYKREEFGQVRFVALQYQLDVSETIEQIRDGRISRVEASPALRKKAGLN
jgi:hypothetical protein